MTANPGSTSIPAGEPAAGACPGAGTIERIAAGETVEPGILGHIQACPACAAAIEEARADAAFLTQTRRLAAFSLAPEGTPRISGYGGLRVLSSGSQGVVYRAVQESTQRPVAIKVLNKSAISSRQQQRAEREAEIAARLRHPNIVTVFESRTLADSRIAVVMEFIDGVAIDAWQVQLLSTDPKRREVLRVFMAVCNAIHHAHLNGVIHRDLKPDNILVTLGGAAARPVVLDFGIAKAGGIQATITGEFAGTPAYASPEQVAGKPEGVDALTDVYSLGVILYKLLCGAMPYEVGGSIFDIARTISETQPTPPRHHAPDLSPDLEAVVLKALRKDKGLRYQSAADLARDLERYLSGDPVDARSGSGWYLLRKAVVVNRGRLAWAGAAAALLIAAGAAVVLSLASAAASARTAQQQHEQAIAENTRVRAVTELLREVLPTSAQLPRGVGAITGAGFTRLYMRLESGAFKDDPELDQTLRQMWGSVYTGFGTTKSAGLVAYAEVSLRNGLVHLRQAYGREHPRVATGMHDLAGVLLVRKRFPEAEAVCRDALAMRRRLLPPGSLAIADSSALLARVLMALGRSDEAMDEAKTAVAAYAGLPEKDAALPVAGMLAIQARVLMDRGEAAAAEPFLRESLTRRLGRLPADDPDVIASLEDAAAFVERCPDCALSALLPRAWDVDLNQTPAAIRDDLTRIPTSDKDIAGQYTGRTAALGHVLALQEALLGPAHHSLVSTLLAQVRSAEAEDNNEHKCAAALRAADLISARYGENDFGVMLCLEEAAAILPYLGRADEAAALERRAVAIWSHVPEEARDDLLVANAQRNLGIYLAIAGRYDEAVTLHRQAIANLIAAVGEHHHVTAHARAILGLCLAELGQMDEAETLTRDAAELAGGLATTSIDAMANIRFARGHVLRLQGRYQESRSMLELCWQPRMRSCTPQFAWRTMFLEDMVADCAALPDAAASTLWAEELSRHNANLPPLH